MDYDDMGVSLQEVVLFAIKLCYLLRTSICCELCYLLTTCICREICYLLTLVSVENYVICL